MDNRLLAVVIAFGALGAVAFVLWYDQAPDMPGTTPNPKLAAMFNERIQAVVGRMTTSTLPGLSDRAADSAMGFLRRVRTVTQHCDYKRADRPHNHVVFDLELTDGTVAKNVYAGGHRCPSSMMGIPSVPVLRIRFDGGLVVEVSSDATERNFMPSDVSPLIDELVTHVISYDLRAHPTDYYKPAPTRGDVQKSWQP